MHRLAKLAFALLCDLEIIGQENLPTEGAVLLVANHFSYVDPVAMVRISPRQVEFVGGFHTPFAPRATTWIPKLWGYYPVYRGTSSADALRAAEAVLDQDGVLGIFPEAGAWATVLRPARPGAAFVAARTGVPLVPMGFDGLMDIMPMFRRGKRARPTIRIGQPFGPFKTSGRGRERRRQLDEIGDQIMRRIAALLPPERRGFFSDDPEIRAAAKGTEVYPWDADPDYL
jgi:1-acyl-sn-glycerol-3-phosphate acyltransferase